MSDSDMVSVPRALVERAIAELEFQARMVLRDIETHGVDGHQWLLDRLTTDAATLRATLGDDHD